MVLGNDVIIYNASSLTMYPIEREDTASRIAKIKPRTNRPSCRRCECPDLDLGFWRAHATIQSDMIALSERNQVSRSSTARGLKAAHAAVVTTVPGSIAERVVGRELNNAIAIVGVEYVWWATLGVVGDFRARDLYSCAYPKE
jgi:hypothetical protein